MLRFNTQGGHMEGWADLLKHFLSSRLSSASLLITATVFQFGPKYLDFVPSLPDGWRWLAFGVMIFTAVQCAWWISLGALRRLVSLLPDDPPNVLTINQLSMDERLLLALVAKHQRVSIQQIAGRVPFSDPLAPNVSANRLAHRDLLDRTLYGDVYLTAYGEAFVMKHRSELPPV